MFGISLILPFTCPPFNWTRKGLQEKQVSFCLKDLNSLPAEHCYSRIVLVLNQGLTDITPLLSGQSNSIDLLLIYHGLKENLTLLFFPEEYC